MVGQLVCCWITINYIFTQTAINNNINYSAAF